MTEATADTPDESGPEARVLAWWQGLAERRGDRAELRRAHDLTEVVFTPAYHRLWQQLRGTTWSHTGGVALVAGTLAHVKAHDPRRPFAAQLAAPAGSEKAPYSGLRFRRLLRYRDKAEMLEPVVRALALIDHSANVTDLANSLYWWGEGWGGDQVRRRWAFDYYGANPKAD